MSRPTLLLGAALAALTLVTYLPVLGHDFVNFDDPLYVTDNPRVQQGISLDTVRWAARSLEPSNWQPLTLLSHALDVELFGLDARGHHLTNLLLHSAAAVTLFALLAAATGARWRSVLVAALFAVHPLHVESVAWVAQRKDLLSGLLFFLVLGAYVRYSRRPSVGRYLLVTALFTLGLTAKSMLVTVPVVLLLLDLWPLGRLGSGLDAGRSAGGGVGARRLRRLGRLLVEKLPWFGLSIAVGLVTIVAQSRAIAPLDLVPPGLRFENALVALFTYVEKMVLPVGLGPFYPMTDAIPLWRTAAAAALVVVATLVAVREARRLPYLLVGWLWYLVTLAPVIGIFQVGAQSHADRYTYLPLVGLFVAVVWGAADWAGKRPRRRALLAAAAALAIVLMAAGAHRQAGHWADGETLFRRALAVTEENPKAHLNLAEALAADGDPEALEHYRAAIELRPDYADAWAGLGGTLLGSDRPEAAIAALERARELAPEDPRVRFTLARAMAALGRDVEAARLLREIVSDHPDFAAAHQGLGTIHESRAEWPAALGHYRRALELDPRRSELADRIRRLEPLARGDRPPG